MTTADELARTMEADRADARAKAEALVYPVYAARQASKQSDELSPALRQWLELNEGESLVDPEHGVYAELTRSSRTTWDLRPLNVDAVMALHYLGLLDVKTTAFDALRKSAPDVMLDAIQVAPGVRTASETWNLQVRRLADA